VFISYISRYYLNREWERNKESLVQYLQQVRISRVNQKQDDKAYFQVHRGIKGVVYNTLVSLDTEGQTQSNSSNATVAGAVIYVQELSGPLGKNVTDSSSGEFWRLLLPGQYRISAYQNVCSAKGVILYSEGVNVTITKESPLLVQDLVLDMVAPCDIGPR
jgi:hypothetical protein